MLMFSFPLTAIIMVHGFESIDFQVTCSVQTGRLEFFDGVWSGFQSFSFNFQNGTGNMSGAVFLVEIVGYKNLVVVHHDSPRVTDIAVPAVGPDHNFLGAFTIGIMP